MTGPPAPRRWSQRHGTRVGSAGFNTVLCGYAGRSISHQGPSLTVPLPLSLGPKVCFEIRVMGGCKVCEFHSPIVKEVLGAGPDRAGNSLDMHIKPPPVPKGGQREVRSLLWGGFGKKPQVRDTGRTTGSRLGGRRGRGQLRGAGAGFGAEAPGGRGSAAGTPWEHAAGAPRRLTRETRSARGAAGSHLGWSASPPARPGWPRSRTSGSG